MASKPYGTARSKVPLTNLNKSSAQVLVGFQLCSPVDTVHIQYSRAGEVASTRFYTHTSGSAEDNTHRPNLSVMLFVYKSRPHLLYGRLLVGLLC